MKTTQIIRIFSVAVLLGILSAVAVQAGKPALSPAQHVQKVIKESITYPEEAVRHCCTGSVDVFFKVDEEGKIQIQKTFTDNEDLEKYVKDQLANICCKGIKVPYNEHYKITITFKLVG